MINDDTIELIVPVAAAILAIVFLIFIFLKSFIDNKKEKEILTEIFWKYGMKADAKILSYKENNAYGNHGIKGKYNYNIEFEYSSRNGTIKCSYTLPTNNPHSKSCIDSIPIIYIPAYLDYYMELISREDFFKSIGHRINLGNDCWLVLFAEDLNLFTNLNEL